MFCFQQRNHPFDSSKPRLTTRTTIFGLRPLIDAIKTEFMSAAADLGDFLAGIWTMQADCTSEICQEILSRRCGHNGFVGVRSDGQRGNFRRAFRFDSTSNSLLTPPSLSPEMGGITLAVLFEEGQENDVGDDREEAFGAVAPRAACGGRNVVPIQ